MKAIYALLICLAASTRAFAQTEIPAEPVPSKVDCRLCHISGSPTKEKPSLLQCQRVMNKLARSTQQAPQTITLGTGKGTYGQVKFSHKAHAEMGEMGGGCYQCHHYDHGGEIQKCGNCHSATRARSDLASPDLKGALHQLCVGCHKEWGHTAECSTCHGKKNIPNPDLPKKIAFRTAYNRGSIVTFTHADHVKSFGLKCARCHQDQTCSSCHDSGMNGAPPRAAVKDSDPMKASHMACFSCHAKDNCASCHSGKPMDTFNHEKSAGWRLNRFHNALACQRCHTGGKFAKLNTDCQSCHKDWQGKFEHKKTGLALDETHSGLGCDSCHGDKEFLAPPACSACHDKSYPKDKPGHIVGKG
ncbi:MAG: cytochrome c3 family protein [Elusimicrobiales bacterium]|nr:cytochrome c3 family protein [Elusimicrobiales bacterium]